MWSLRFFFWGGSFEWKHFLSDYLSFLVKSSLIARSQSLQKRACMRQPTSHKTVFLCVCFLLLSEKHCDSSLAWCLSWPFFPSNSTVFLGFSPIRFSYLLTYSRQYHYITPSLGFNPPNALLRVLRPKAGFHHRPDVPLAKPLLPEKHLPMSRCNEHQKSLAVGSRYGIFTHLVDFYGILWVTKCLECRVHGNFDEAIPPVLCEHPSM